MRTPTTLQGVISAALLALGCAASAATNSPSDDELPRRCEGPACTRVAMPVAWPDVRVEEDSVPFNVHGAFRIRLPKGAIEIMLLGDNGLTVRYPNRRWIGVQRMDEKSTGLQHQGSGGEARPDALRFSDIPRILYTKTPADPEPTRLGDLEIWRLALVFKNSHFENATQVQVAERGPLTVYFADAGMASTSGDIEIVHRRIKDAYVFVQFKGFSFDDVRRVVGSLEATRE